MSGLYEALEKICSLGLVRILVNFTKTFGSKVRHVSMETGLTKEKPYDFCITPPSLKSLRPMTPPQ